MQIILTNLRLPAMISFLAVLPFMLLELVNWQQFNEGFPFALFGFLWVLSLLFVTTLAPIIQTVRSGKRVLAKPMPLMLRVAVLLLIALVWGAFCLIRCLASSTFQTAIRGFSHWLSQRGTVALRDRPTLAQPI